MATIVLRSIKGAPLTIQEADDNFNNINTEVGTKLTATNFNATNILTLLSDNDLDSSGQGLNAETVASLPLSDDADEFSTSTVVARDAFGIIRSTGFIGNTFTGNLTGNVVGNLTGTVTGNASNVNGTVAIGNGGTGGTTASTARTNLGLGSIATQSSSSVSITGGTISGITDIAVADGGTGASNATQARTNLGLVIGADIQPYSAELTGIAASTSTGLYVRTGTASIVQRTLVVGGNGLSITNADGVSGNPTISIATTASMTLNSLTTSSISLPSITKTGTNGTGDIGSSTNKFGTIYGTASSATYADLAEKYTTDEEYEAGTVIAVAAGGDSEGTQTWIHAQRVLGVISTAPAYLMNDSAPGQAIALRGRVPVKVVGPIRKGQPLVSTPSGYATFGDHQNSFAMALESNSNDGVKLVECVIL